MIVAIILGLMLVAGIGAFISNLSMTPEDHRREAQNQALQAARTGNAKRATAHQQRAEAHLYIADEKDQGRM